MGITFNRLEDRAVDDDEAVMHFYDAQGRQVPEGDPAARVQYLSNDPGRPDAKATQPAQDKAVHSPAQDKAAKPTAEGN
jgi:hypothetical protein